MRWSMLLPSLLAFLSLFAHASAAEKQLEIRWRALELFLIENDLIGRGRVMLVLPDSAIVEGRIVGVGKEDLVVTISKTSDSAAHAKGRVSIPRNSVTTIRLTRKQGPWRGVGLLGGIVGGLTAATGYALAHDEGASGTERAAFLAMLVGPGVGVYFAGRHFDRKTFVLRVLPD